MFLSVLVTLGVGPISGPWSLVTLSPRNILHVPFMVQFNPSPNRLYTDLKTFFSRLLIQWKTRQLINRSIYWKVAQNYVFYFQANFNFGVHSPFKIDSIENGLLIILSFLDIRFPEKRSYTCTIYLTISHGGPPIYLLPP